MRSGKYENGNMELKQTGAWYWDILDMRIGIMRIRNHENYENQKYEFTWDGCKRM